MKAKKCVLILNNRWGYVYTPQTCESIAQAKRIAHEAIQDGFAWAYRIIKCK